MMNGRWKWVMQHNNLKLQASSQSLAIGRRGSQGRQAQANWVTKSSWDMLNSNRISRDAIRYSTTYQMTTFCYRRIYTLAILFDINLHITISLEPNFTGDKELIATAHAWQQVGTSALPEECRSKSGVCSVGMVGPDPPGTVKNQTVQWFTTITTGVYLPSVRQFIAQLTLQINYL